MLLTKFGSLYLNNGPCQLPDDSGANIRVYDAAKDGPIKLGPTDKDHAITWVTIHEKNTWLHVSNRPLLYLRWEEATANMLDTPKPVDIDGKTYVQRMLGLVEGESEWVRLLRATNNGDATWHWWKQFFFVQENPEQKRKPGEGEVRGGGSCYDYQTLKMSGYRPVLVRPETDITADPYPCKNAGIVMSNGASVFANIVAADDYDIVLKGIVRNLRPLRGCKGVALQGRTAVIARECIEKIFV